MFKWICFVYWSFAIIPKTGIGRSDIRTLELGRVKVLGERKGLCVPYDILKAPIDPPVKDRVLAK